MSNIKNTVQENEVPKKSRKYTIIFSVFFLLLLLISALGASYLTYDKAAIDASEAFEIADFLSQNQVSFLLWRLFLYSSLIGIFYVWSRRRNYSESQTKLRTIRYSLYLVLIELFVVQNSLGKLFALID